MLISFISLFLSIAQADVGGASASNQLSEIQQLQLINTQLATGSAPGTASAANQVIGNASLSSIDTKLTAPLSCAQSGVWSFALGAGSSTIGKVDQGLGGASAWKVDGSAVTQPVSGTVTATQGTGGVSAWKVDGSAVTQPVSGTVTANQGGTWNVNNVSGTVSLPTGAATSANQTTANGSLSSIDSKLTSPLAVSQSGTWNVNNVSGTVSLPTGAATAAKQPALGTAGTPSTDVISVQGITSMTALKVDGSAVTQPVSGTVTANQGGTWNITNVSGTVSLPTGAATSAAQTTANASLSSIDTKLNSPISANLTQLASTAIAAGNGVAGAGVQRVTIASDNSTFAVNVNSVVASATLSDMSSTATITGTCSTPTTACPANSFAFINVHGISEAQVLISGTFTGATMNVDGSMDGGITWATLLTTTGPYGVFSNNSFSTAAKYRIARAAALTVLRLRVSALSTGSVVAAFNASIGSQIVETIKSPFFFSNLAGAATTTVKSGAGILERICFNNGTASSTITLYDNTAASGTKIASFAPGSVSVFPSCPELNVAFGTGLTVVTTVASTDITIIYK